MHFLVKIVFPCCFSKLFFLTIDYLISYQTKNFGLKKELYFLRYENRKLKNYSFSFLNFGLN